MNILPVSLPKQNSDQFFYLMAKILIIIGLLFILTGLLVHFFPGIIRLPGHLPGDIHYEGTNGSFHFPVITSILVSLVLSLILWLIRK
jgi:uncharacterized integral membrane protein